MSRNITYADRTPAVYASKREQTVSFGAVDFPARIHIQPALEAAGLDLESDYVGNSHNPFMIEAFIAAIDADNLTVFSQQPHKASAGRTALIGQRFGIDPKRTERVFDSTIAALTSMQDESRRYYIASMFLSTDVYNRSVAGTPDSKAGVFTIVNAVNVSHRYGINNLFSVNKMVALHKVYNRLTRHTTSSQYTSPAQQHAVYDEANKKLGYIAAFTVTEIERIMAEFEPATYALPGRVKQGFGCKTLDEAITLIQTTNAGFLESMIPAL